MKTDINKLTIQELKALAYDQMAQLEQTQAGLKFINQKIVEKSQEKEVKPKQEKEVKPKQEKEVKPKQEKT